MAPCVTMIVQQSQHMYSTALAEVQGNWRAIHVMMPLLRCRAIACPCCVAGQDAVMQGDYIPLKRTPEEAVQSALCVRVQQAMKAAVAPTE